jgi:hypothetical protein
MGEYVLSFPEVSSSAKAEAGQEEALKGLLTKQISRIAAKIW